MAADVVIPEVGEAGMEVVFVRWRKNAGDAVVAGDILFELDTEKTVVEVEAWTSGTLADLRVTDGDIVAPRQVVARILAPGESVAVQATPEGSAEAGPTAAPDEGPRTPVERPDAPADGPSLSPRARALARDLGIDPSGIRGTGPGGMVTEQDVRMAAATGDQR